MITPHTTAPSAQPHLSAHRTIRVNASRAMVDQREPSLSFQISAPASQYFDVVIATDPALFAPTAAHRRTAKNFRISRQDFEGEAIEIETGFYMLPRAFLRDVISLDPRPTRLFYLAIGYADDTGRDPVYSTALDHLDTAPSVILSESLSAASLSHVLGVRVEQLGLLGRSGRVVRPMQDAQSVEMPRMIGGLPISRRSSPVRQIATPPSDPAPAPSPAPITSQPVPAPIQNSAKAPVEDTPPKPVLPEPPHPPHPPHPPVASDTPARMPTAPAADFVDEDTAYGNGAGESQTDGSGFRDLDASPAPSATVPYDDGFGAMSFSAQETDETPIPPLDPVPNTVPDPVPDTVPHATPAPSPTAPPPSQAPASGDGAEALVELAIQRGAGNRYDALNLDGAFRGRFGTDHPYYHTAHEGLRFGPHQASQDSGELGELLSLMREADPASFDRIFGAESEALITMTTAAGPASHDVPGGRSARVQPIAGHDIWEDPWASRFREAGQHPPFQSAMRAQIITRRWEPVAPIGEALGLTDTQGRAMLLMLALHLGVEGTRRAVRHAINPFDAPAKTAAALEALGHASLDGYQRAKGLPTSDNIDEATHFALIADLRALGPDSPVAVPDREAAKDLLITSQPPGALGDALLKLRTDTALADGEV
ncbi:hypothetical protein [Celeribacter arenosi]|uniref:Uncharacterized protein n=1 Tax=Celeribacter arenosi TaxID=792649 RepID=A0ABP7KGH0_9RHOB